MTRFGMALVIVLVSPALLFAQVSQSSTVSDSLVSAAVIHSLDDSAIAAASRLTFAMPGAFAQQSAPQASKTGKSGDSTDQPPIEGSMVGYIDDAVVGSEIRTRFDAAFDDNNPDRAEFFYAECGCDSSTARGPNGLVKALNFEQLYLTGEFAPAKRLSFLVDVPLRWIQPQAFVAGSGSFTNQGGISDVQAGFKFAAVAAHREYLTFQFVASFPSGNSTEGLGTAHYSVMPSLLYFQRVTDRFSFEGQLGDTHPIGGDTPGFTGDVLDYGVGPSYELYRGENVRFAPVLELVGWKVLGGMQTSFIPAWSITSTDGINIVNLKVGARTSFGEHDSFYLGFGQALTHELWYKHIIRLEYRHSF
jgi:hypothetical protein